MWFSFRIHPTEKKYLWHLLVSAEPCLIIGVHLPILLPIANVGLIIIDEEHEIGYQEKKHPKINTKEAALFRAHQAAILLSSVRQRHQLPPYIMLKKMHGIVFQSA